MVVLVCFGPFFARLDRLLTHENCRLLSLNLPLSLKARENRLLLGMRTRPCYAREIVCDSAMLRALFSDDEDDVRTGWLVGWFAGAAACLL